MFYNMFSEVMLWGTILKLNYYLTSKFGIVENMMYLCGRK